MAWTSETLDEWNKKQKPLKKPSNKKKKHSCNGDCAS